MGVVCGIVIMIDCARVMGYRLGVVAPMMMFIRSNEKELKKTLVDVGNQLLSLFAYIFLYDLKYYFIEWK